MTDISTPSQLTSCELTLESLKPSSNSISPISTPTMASSSLPFILEVSKSQRNNSASSSNSDDVGDAQVQQFPATETSCLDIKNNYNSHDHIQSFSSLNCHQQSGNRKYYSGYLQHCVSMASGLVKTWKRTYFCLYENQLMCYKTQDTAIPLFEVHFTIHSVLTHNEAETDSSQSLEKHNLKSLHRTLSSFGSLILVLQFVEITGHQIPATTVDVPMLLQAENEADYVAWTEGLNHVIQARKRALLQVNGEKSRRDDVTLLAQLQLSGSATSIDLPKRRSLDNGQEITKMLRRTSGAFSVVPDIPLESNNLAEVETYETFSSKYLLMKEIGEGSFSIVHRAVNRMNGQVCAVKCCKASQALEEEERLLRTLSHPNVVSLEGVFQRDKNLHFVVMDYLKDGDLCDQLIERQRLPEPEARRIIRQVVEGLAYLHRRCVLHRDIKPENILIHGNMVKIADFGLAKELEQPTTLLKRSCGTLEYAAPELLCGQPYGLKSDVFSLGIVLYVLLFGAFPFSVESAAALQCMDHFRTSVDVRDMSCLSSSNVQWKIVSPLAQDVLLKMLKTSDTERISAEDLLNHPWFNEADAGMSESISTPKDLELSRIEDCEAMGFAELLSRGFRVVKYGDKESMTPYVTSLSINFMEECINWTARKNPLRTSEVATVCRTGRDRAISLRDIKEIREGHTTKAFQSHKNMKPIPPPELCISIICPWRTLDLVIEAPSQRRFMVRGLRRLITSDA